MLFSARPAVKGMESSASVSEPRNHVNPTIVRSAPVRLRPPQPGDQARGRERGPDRPGRSLRSASGCPLLAGGDEHDDTCRRRSTTATRGRGPASASSRQKVIASPDRSALAMNPARHRSTIRPKSAPSRLDVSTTAGRYWSVDIEPRAKTSKPSRSGVARPVGRGRGLSRSALLESVRRPLPLRRH